MLDSLDATSTAGLVGALAGAAVGGLLGLLGVLLGLDHARRRDELATRRRAYVDLMQALDHADRIGRRVETYTNKMEKAHKEMAELRSAMLLSTNVSMDFDWMRRMERLLESAGASGVTASEMHEAFRAVSHALGVVYLVAPPLFRDLGGRAAKSTGTDDHPEAMAALVFACRRDLGAQSDRPRHMLMRWDLRRRGRLD